MKFLLNFFLYFLVLFSFEHRAHSLSDNQIKEICKKKQRRLSCVKDLKFRKLNLQEGKYIEIPVIPFKE